MYFEILYNVIYVLWFTYTSNQFSDVLPHSPEGYKRKLIGVVVQCDFGIVLGSSVGGWFIMVVTTA